MRRFIGAAAAIVSDWRNVDGGLMEALLKRASF